MPILRGLRASKIDDCRKHRKNQGKLQNDPRRMGICEALNETQVLFGIFRREIMNIKEYVKHREETYFQKYDNIVKYDWDRRDNKIFTCIAECRCCHHKYTVTLRESDTLSDIANKLQTLKDDTKDWYTNEDGNSLCSYCYERFQRDKERLQRDKKRQAKIHNCLWCEYSYIKDDDTLCCFSYSHSNENISCEYCCSDWLESENDKEPEKAENQRQEYYKRHTGQEIDEKTNTCIDCGKPLPANLNICDKCLFEEYNKYNRR